MLSHAEKALPCTKCMCTTGRTASRMLMVYQAHQKPGSGRYDTPQSFSPAPICYHVNHLWYEKQQPWEVFQKLLPQKPMVFLVLLLPEFQLTKKSGIVIHYRQFLQEHFAEAHRNHYLVDTGYQFTIRAYRKSSMWISLLHSLQRMDIQLPDLVINTIKQFL